MHLPVFRTLLQSPSPPPIPNCRRQTGNELAPPCSCIESIAASTRLYDSTFPHLGQGGGQNLERPNVERPIFRKFETSNIEITKVELFDFSISEFILYFYDCLNYSKSQNTYLIINHKIRNFLNFDSFTNCQILKICQFFKFNNFRTDYFFFFELVNNGNFMIF